MGPGERSQVIGKHALERRMSPFPSTVKSVILNSESFVLVFEIGFRVTQAAGFELPM